MANPGKSHWKALKFILRYLKGAPDVGLTFHKSEGISILGYIDSDSAVDLDQRGPQLDTSLLSLAVPLVGNRLYNLVSLCLQPRQNILQQRRQ